MSFSDLTPEQRHLMAQRGVAARNAQRAAQGQPPIPKLCKRGHELTDENTAIYYRGGDPNALRVWYCRTCRKERQRREYTTKHGAAARRRNGQV